MATNTRLSHRGLGSRGARQIRRKADDAWSKAPELVGAFLNIPAATSRHLVVLRGRYPAKYQVQEQLFLCSPGRINSHRMSMSQRGQRCVRSSRAEELLEAPLGVSRARPFHTSIQRQTTTPIHTIPIDVNETLPTILASRPNPAAKTPMMIQRNTACSQNCRSDYS